ncbi:MAG: large conductance mechanosensitive channel protein MscL [Eubacterium sp.]|nr:large conductance mechanosensitive channel protein MscL [Eubacterium sp.]
MKFFDEFKKFISRGNVMDMAVGIIIGGAFTAIVNSLVDDILNPIIGLAGGANLDTLSISLGGAVTLNYGKFLSAIINFLLIALVLFCIIKVINGAKDKLEKKKDEPEAAPTTKICPYCKSEIPIDATRCPHCTSELKADKEA